MSGSLMISRVRIHDRAGLYDVAVRNGVIDRVVPHDASMTGAEGSGILDGRGGLLSPSFTEIHIHPDKSYSLDGAETVPGEDSFARATRIKAGFTVDTVADRAERALRLAVANGVTRVRATADVDTGIGLTAFHGLREARERMRDLMDIQIVAFPQEGIFRDSGVRELLTEALRSGADLIGGWPNVEAGPELEQEHVRTVFDLAEEFDVDVDIHADCYIDPNEAVLEFIADETLRRGYQGRVLASHCCGLEVLDDDHAARVVRRVAEAGVTVAIIPLNLLDGGPRGLARPHELLAAGARVVIGSDNMNDGWYPLGNLNPLAQALATLWGAGFDDEDDIDLIWGMISDQAAVAFGASPAMIEPGHSADLVLHQAPSRHEALLHPNLGTVTIKAGRIVGARRVQRTGPATEHAEAAS